MRRLEFVGPRRLEFREVTEPRIESDDQVIVLPVASTTCDLDRAIIAGATPFRGPFAIGHECIAEVVDVGDDAGVIPGARVVVPWHPCCTVCAACLQGRMADCEQVPRFAMYGVPLGGDFGGLFDDLVLVPFGAALVPVPDGVAADAVASASDNLSDAYGGVSRALATRPHGSVLVLGGTGSIGQWAAGWAVMLGAARTVYVDRDEESRGLAEGYGATAVASLDELDRAAAFDVLIDAGAHAGRLADAIGWLGAGGHCHSVGIYFEPTTGLPLGSMFMNGISFSTGRPSVSPVLGEVLLAVAEGRFDPSPVFSDRLPFDDAAAALAELPRKAVFVR
jgi:threonine dehydrogenase-like Zn-dependent dehydrogenase